MFHLHATLLQQPLHKLPVGLGDDVGRQIRQFGLPEVLPQAAGLLHVLLHIKQKQNAVMHVAREKTQHVTGLSYVRVNGKGCYTGDKRRPGCVHVCAGVCWKVSGAPTEAVSEGLFFSTMKAQRDSLAYKLSALRVVNFQAYGSGVSVCCACRGVKIAQCIIWTLLSSASCSFSPDRLNVGTDCFSRAGGNPW